LVSVVGTVGLAGVDGWTAVGRHAGALSCLVSVVGTVGLAGVDGWTVAGRHAGALSCLVSVLVGAVGAAGVGAWMAAGKRAGALSVLVSTIMGRVGPAVVDDWTRDGACTAGALSCFVSVVAGAVGLAGKCGGATSSLGPALAEAGDVAARWAGVTWSFSGRACTVPSGEVAVVAAGGALGWLAGAGELVALEVGGGSRSRDCFAGMRCTCDQTDSTGALVGSAGGSVCCTSCTQGTG
jgi:hypothetical protein